MRSWQPRRPSLEIERRLFGAEGHEAAVAGGRHRIHLPWWQTFGISAAACAVLLFTLLNVAQFTATHASPRGTLLSLSNHSCAVSLAMASAPRNTWTAPILGWTNEGSTGLSIRSFDLLNTNRLLH
jgi:hypothetical protein